MATCSAPADRLWTVVADVTTWPAHVPTFASVETLPDSPTSGVGARHRVRQPGLPAATYEVTSGEPGRSFTWVAHTPGVTTTATHTVRPEGVGSRLQLEVAWAGPLAPLLRVLLGRHALRMIQTEAAALTAWAERDADVDVRGA